MKINFDDLIGLKYFFVKETTEMILKEKERSFSFLFIGQQRDYQIQFKL